MLKKSQGIFVEVYKIYKIIYLGLEGIETVEHPLLWNVK